MLDTEYAYGITEMVECSDLCRILYLNIIQKHFNSVYLQNCLVKISRHSPEQNMPPPSKLCIRNVVCLGFVILIYQGVHCCTKVAASVLHTERVVTQPESSG